MLPEERRQEIGLDNRISYYDKEHLNYYGASIYTEYFFKYLIDNYGLEDMRGKGGHEAWEEEYEREQKKQALDLEKSRLLSDRRIYQELGDQSKVDELTTKIKAIRDKKKEL
jgi:hypothetical protein